MNAALGPVSRALEEDLRAYVVRGGIVVWLDADCTYTGLVERLIALRAVHQLPYEVRAYRGSHLELMMAIDDLADAADKPALVIHAPGFNKESIRLSPLLELSLAGTYYLRALPTVITTAAAGLATPDAIEAFCRKDGLTLERADAWLTSQTEASVIGLRGQLGLHRVPALLDDLFAGGPISDKLTAPDALASFWEHLEAVLGLPAQWRDICPPPGAQTHAEDIAFIAASWALAVEYVDDLRRPPRDPLLVAIPALPRAVIDAGRGLAVHLRERHRVFYRRAAGEAEGMLHEEVKLARAEDLGKIDTFEFEERKVFQAALAALGEQRWDVALQWAKERLDGSSFWIEVGRALRKSAWQLAQDAACLGRAIAAAGPALAATSLEVALERYVARGAAVDQAHRALEQRWQAANDPQLPEYDALRARVQGLRELWHAWADTWARDFGALCQKQGFLPPPALQQRMLFDDVVRPLVHPTEVTAVFLVDALRFEMAAELQAMIDDLSSTTIELRARYAELPTVTAVGMNALAPVSEHGKLRPAIVDGALVGFTRGEYRVNDPESRRRAMQDRVGGAACKGITLNEVLSRSPACVKAAKTARLVVVHVEEIDSAGEKGVGLTAFGPALQRLKTAWRMLWELNVRRFVITADHGFLLLDDAIREAQTHGRKIDPWRRHAISTLAADHRDELRVPLDRLGYEGAQGLQLMMPASTAVFDTGRRSLSFVHGGNSLQERVIPVLTIQHKSLPGGDTVTYRITATAGDDDGDLHTIRGKVEVLARRTLDFGGRRQLDLALRVTDAPDVQVEVSQTRGGATLRGGSLLANIGEDFEVFFRLSGPAEARVLVALHHPAFEADVEPCEVQGRFAVSALRVRPPEPAPEPAPQASRTAAASAAPEPAGNGREWLQSLPDGPERRLFEHLAIHGIVSEEQAAAIFGNARALRRFSANFESFTAKVPFVVRIDSIAGTRRYVREGHGQ